MDRVLGYILIAVFFMAVFFCFGFLAGANNWSAMIEKCREKNNVYECELRAFPKEQADETK